MNALQSATAEPIAPAQPIGASSSPNVQAVRVPMVGLLRAMLLGEALAALALAIFLSSIAVNSAAEDSIRFAAGGAFLFAIFAAVASRGARRRRAWAWTMAAILQVVLAVGTGLAVLVTEWQPSYLAGFGVATLVMFVLSTTAVRRALGQE